MRRNTNEDAFLVADLATGDVGIGASITTYRVGGRGLLLAVSDGMGGAAGGEIASHLAVTALHEALRGMPRNDDIAEQLKLAAKVANRRVYSHAQQYPELKGMGTTLTAALVHGGAAYIAQIGDSRAYLIRDDQIKQLTRDQTLAQLLLECGALKPEQASLVEQKPLAQAVGPEPDIQVALTAAGLCRGDHLIICSDGLSNKVTPQEMKRAIQEETNLATASRRLVEMAAERGGEDDTTVILARLGGVGLEVGADRRVTESFELISQFVVS